MNTINETLVNAIYNVIDSNNGTFSIDVEVNGMTVYVDGSYEVEGYCEDNYFNGTGAWVTTYVSVIIDSIEAYDEDGNEVDPDCDLAEIERNVERLAA